METTDKIMIKLNIVFGETDKNSCLNFGEMRERAGSRSETPEMSRIALAAERWWDNGTRMHTTDVKIVSLILYFVSDMIRIKKKAVLTRTNPTDCLTIYPDQ